MSSTPAAMSAIGGVEKLIKALSVDDPNMVSRYRILGVLGAGGMGRVLLGLGPDARFVAIKQIHTRLLDDGDYRARFHREVAISTRVSGAFTAAVVDFDTASEIPWLASVFIAGVPLDSAVQQYGPLPLASVRTLASGLASALHSIHTTGLIHRDLKPANVILAADGPRVIDFGIARTVEAEESLTEVGSVLGSPAYMSPEQAAAEPITAAADIFSLGSLLYMAATGVSPFAAASAPFTLFNIVHTEPDLAPVPEQLRELIAGCLRKDPRARPTAAQILDYLGVLAIQSSPWPAPIHQDIATQAARLRELTADPERTQIILAAQPHRPVPVDQPKPRRGLLIGVACAVVAVIVAASAVVVLMRGGAPAAPNVAGAAAVMPTLAQLREVDACAWLRQALGPVLPESVAKGVRRETDSWTWRTTSSWGCDGSSGSGRMTVEIGRSLPGFTSTQRTVAQLDLLRRGRDCAFAVAGSEPATWGISVDTGVAVDCSLAEYTVDRLVAALPSLVVDPAAARSLASVDPCALVTEEEVRAAGSSGPGVPTAHGCSWSGPGRVKVELGRPDDLDTGTVTSSDAVDIGGGTVVYNKDIYQDADNRGCSSIYRFRAVDAQFHEAVTVQVFGAQPEKKRCPAGEAIVAALIPRLPQR
ncbi:serine/threonine-protein kinase [Nocardia sp. NPDC058658]|uniref:serine/threonine-protein kinase n=1 Tax=Nocardia sp. NPDC058658 TaxID=3346580 RepID=UPI003664AAE9